jgi:hypothetical protein
MRPFPVLLVCLVLAAAAPPAFAVVVFKCAAADGRISYSDQSCPAAQTLLRAIDTGAPAALAARADLARQSQAWGKRQPARTHAGGVELRAQHVLPRQRAQRATHRQSARVAAGAASPLVPSRRAGAATSSSPAPKSR